jgi:hypothetical protein
MVVGVVVEAAVGEVLEEAVVEEEELVEIGSKLLFCLLNKVLMLKGVLQFS